MKSQPQRQMNQISKYLTLEEAIKSNTAIRKGILNNPTNEQIKCMIDVGKIHTQLCDHFGFKVPISSFFRSVKLNKEIGGATNSQHIKGEAIDIDADFTQISNNEVFNYIKDHCTFDQLICEGDNGNGTYQWVHVSFSSIHNRKEILKAIFIKGKQVSYKKIN